LARLDRQFSAEDRKAIQDAAGGKSLSDIAHVIVDALDPDIQLEAAKKVTGVEEPPPEAIEQAACTLLAEAAKPIATNPALRNTLISLKKASEQTIDTVTKDQVLEAGYSQDAKDKARTIVESFEKFIQEHKDEITALQVLYNRPYKERLTKDEVMKLAAAIQRPPVGCTYEAVWEAYAKLDRSKVHGSGQRVWADIVSLVRFAMRRDGELRPFRDRVNERFAQWIGQQQSNGRHFTDEQRQWLEAIRDHIAASLAISTDDFDYVPFLQRGGLGKANQVFGKDLVPLLEELNSTLVQ
jgi:type I restriction enzyme R subunit